jgi:hypothetical protein
MAVLFRWLYLLKPRGTHTFYVLGAVIIFTNIAEKTQKNVCSAVFILPNDAEEDKKFLKKSIVFERFP